MMKKGITRNARTFDRTMDQLTSFSRKPRYIGFLVNPYTPEQTSEEDEPGFRGFTEVPARLNDATPERLTITPAMALLAASGTAPGNVKSRPGAFHETLPITIAIRMTTTRGGIFSLSPCIVAMFRKTIRLKANSGPHQEERCQTSAEHDVKSKRKSRPPQRYPGVFNE